MKKCEIRIIGMKRSCHHAIAFWIAEHLDYDEILHAALNFPGEELSLEKNIKHQGYGTPITNRILEPCWPIVYVIKQKTPVSIKSKIYHIPIMYNIENIEDIFLKTPIQDWECIILSSDDWTIEQIRNGEVKEKHDKWYGKRDSKINILVLRDPFNLVASNLAKHQYAMPTANVVNLICELWKNHAKEFLGQTSFLQNLIKVNVNKWHTNSDYRLELMKKLNINLDPSPYQRIPDFGGSSFSGKAKQGKASELKIIERWQYFRNMSEFRKMRENRELMELFRNIFVTLGKEFEEWLKEK